MEGLIFGGAYLWREMCVSKSIGLALFFFVFEGIFQVQALQGAYIGRGDLTEGFLCYEFGGGGAFIWRGLFSDFYGILTSKKLLWTMNI